MTRNDLLTISQRLREYKDNPHHINPMSESFGRLIVDAADALSEVAVDYDAQHSRIVAAKDAEIEQWGRRCDDLGHNATKASDEAYELRKALARVFELNWSGCDPEERAKLRAHVRELLNYAAQPARQVRR